MNDERPMYAWRRMTPAQREEALADRQRRDRPWHGPPHYESDAAVYLVTAACYEHRPVIGTSPMRMAEVEADLLSAAQGACGQVFAWVVLPNHYHLLAHAPRVKGLLAALGKLHGRTAHGWHGDDGCRGRQVWHRAAETVMKSDRHFWAAVNYVLHNPVRHGYVERWQEWPYSSAAEYLAEVGRETAERRWREYPLLGFGREWDPHEL